MAPPPRDPLHAAAAAIVVAVDYALASRWIPAGYAVRGAVGLALWLLLSRAIPLAGDLAVPHWGRVRESLRWLSRFASFFLPIGLGTLACVYLAARGLGWSAVYTPGAIQSFEETWPYVLHGLIAAPLVEELIYRGIIYPRLEGAIGGGWAVFASGFIFWVLHWVNGGVVTPVNHLVAGWILSWAARGTRSLFAPTALHALGNLLVLSLDVLWLEDPGLIKAILGS